MHWGILGYTFCVLLCVFCHQLHGFCHVFLLTNLTTNFSKQHSKIPCPNNGVTLFIVLKHSKNIKPKYCKIIKKFSIYTNYLKFNNYSTNKTPLPLLLVALLPFLKYELF